MREREETHLEEGPFHLNETSCVFGPKLVAVFTAEVETSPTLWFPLPPVAPLGNLTQTQRSTQPNITQWFLFGLHDKRKKKCDKRVE